MKKYHLSDLFYFLQTLLRDEILSRDAKKNVYKRKFHPGMKRVEFHPRMKFSLKENLSLSMKTYNKIYHFFLNY